MGIIWLVVTMNGMQLAAKSAEWFSTTGTVVDAWIERDTRSDSDGEVETYFKPFIEYSYQVNGDAFHSQRVDFSPQPSYSSVSRAEECLAQYPVGREVEVFYDPEDYGEAVLLREASGSTWSLIGSSALIIFAVVGWVGALVKQKRSQLPKPFEDSIPG
jgi:hypothetical protein